MIIVVQVKKQSRRLNNNALEMNEIKLLKGINNKKIMTRSQKIQTCKNAIPTATPATTSRFFSSHSSPANKQPFSLIILDKSPRCMYMKKKKNREKMKMKLKRSIK